MEIEYINPQGPGLVMGYDWERYGGTDDPELNKKRQEWSKQGVTSILEVHERYNKPLTFFVLTKILDVPQLRELVIEASELDFVELAQHSHTHPLVKGLKTVDQDPLPFSDFVEDVQIAQNNLLSVIGEPPKGFRAPLGYYEGFKNDEEVVQALSDISLQYVSSDARNQEHKFPAPWKDTSGRFRQPYIYKDSGIVEIPIQGWSDNVLKGMSRHTPIEDAGIEKEIDHHMDNIDVAIENDLVYAPAYHPWSIGEKDPDASAIEAILQRAEREDIPVYSYGDMAKIVRGK